MFTRLKAACARLASGEAETYPPRKLRSADLDRVHWDHSVDIAVIGFGGAGATAPMAKACNY